jgi:hypothetical protein
VDSVVEPTVKGVTENTRLGAFLRRTFERPDENGDGAEPSVVDK